MRWMDFYESILLLYISRLIGDDCHHHDWRLFIVYLMGPGLLVTPVKMFKWLLKLWLHKGRSLHFAWVMIFHWQYCPRSHTCFMIILSNGLHRFAIIYHKLWINLYVIIGVYFSMDTWLWGRAGQRPVIRIWKEKTFFATLLLFFKAF